MMPPRDVSADTDAVTNVRPDTTAGAHAIASHIEAYLAANHAARVIEDGKLVFDMASAKCKVEVAGQICRLQLWDETRHLSREVVAVEARADTLRLQTARLGQTQTKLLQITTATRLQLRGEKDKTRSAARHGYVTLIERALLRHFPDWKPEGFRTSMDLEKSFGPAYARGWLLRGNQAWAVIGVNGEEGPATIEGILTVGILWLHHCREKTPGQKQFAGLKVVLPRGCATLTASRMAWLNTEAAQWELWELDAATGELTERDPDDQGNLRTRLIHRPDEHAAQERFADAVARVFALVSDGDRVETRLRSSAEMTFCLHGLEFARARLSPSGNNFAPRMEVSVGTKEDGVLLSADTQAECAERVAELFARRCAITESSAFARRAGNGPATSIPLRRIGPPSTQAAHAKVQGRVRPVAGQRAPQHDPLYRAAPERWLESVLRKDLSTLTRGLAPAGDLATTRDNFGNRSQPLEESRSIIPRLDARHVYTQVPAIAGASDRGMLDLLGVTADGRLAVIELKADEDMQFALQGLDYWVRVRHHHLHRPDDATGLGEFQRHGYFRGLELAEQAPRLYLVAPALRIHPATEIVLRYLSRRVEWNLLALDERWRSQIRVVWRRQGGRA